MSKAINYTQLMRKAMRQFVADVLAQVARDGLPGQHHFYITFDTTHPGVDMSDDLRAKYPGDMTIVMQHWFDNLAVMKDRFTVTLNFGDTPEPIVIPFEAIKVFMDPSVELGLRLQAAEDGEKGPFDTAMQTQPARPAQPAAKPAQDAAVISLDTFRNKP